MKKIREVFVACLFTFVFILSGCTSTPTMSNEVTIGGKLTASAENPTNSSTGMGLLEATYNKETNVLNWTISYSGLTGPVKAGHFHGPAIPGQNAGVVLGFTGSTESPIKGSATITPAQAADLLAGKWYVNLHTAMNPSGEIRAQALVLQ